MLVDLDLLDTITEERKVDKKWGVKEAKSKSIIVQCIADIHLEYIKECDTAMSMLLKLQEKFERRGIASQLFCYKK